jgi:hypothetical protein
MEREKEATLTSLMRPTLREAYLAIQKVFEENEYKPTLKVEYSRNGNVKSIEFKGLTGAIVKKVVEAVWEIAIAREENNLDREEDRLGFGYRNPIHGSLTNTAWFKMS